MTETLTDEQAAKIAGRIKVLQSEKDDIEEAIENLKQKLEERFGIGAEQVIGDKDNGFFTVKTFVGAKFDQAYLKKQDPEAWEKASETQQVVTSALAKAKLSPEEYKLGQKPNTKTTVLVELLGDE